LEIQTEKDAKNMTVTECRAWLTEHSWNILICVYYLIECEKKLYKSFLPKPKRSASRSGGGNDGGSDDQGSGQQIFNLPTWLHLIHCAKDNQAQEALNEHYNAKSREEFEANAKKSTVRKKPYEEKVTDLFNNETNKYIFPKFWKCIMHLWIQSDSTLKTLLA
jgi:hypothetical protein